MGLEEYLEFEEVISKKEYNDMFEQPRDFIGYIQHKLK